MQLNKEKYEDTKIQKFVENEKIFSKSHIHTIYILFVNICKENDYKLTPSILCDLFRQLTQITNIKYEEYKIGLFHLQMDNDRDGIINFQDFLFFITSIIKFTYNELYYKKGINLLSSLSLSSDRKLFIDIISNIFTNIVNYVGENKSNSITDDNNLNPFTYYDYSIKYLPFYKYYCGYKNNINMNNYYNSQKKFTEFNEMINNYSNLSYIKELQNLLNSQNTNEYYKGLSIFKKSIKPLNYINNELLILIYIKKIFLFLTVILNANLLNKILMIFNIINNKTNNNTQDSNMISPEVIYTFLVIIRRILNLYVFLNETFFNCGSETYKNCFELFVKELSPSFNELSLIISSKILSPLSNYYNYFYDIFELKNKKSNTNEAKIKYVMYQLILLTSKLKYEYYVYFINNTDYLDWIITDVKENINLKNKNTINNGINSIEENSNVDYIAIDNVVYNCINIIDITLIYEKHIENDTINNKILFIKNLYLKILLIVKNIQDIIFNNDINYSLLNENNILSKKNNNNDEHIPLKSKYICLLGLLNNLNINLNNLNLNNYNNQNIQEFDNSKFILQIYNEEFRTKYKELTLPFCFYLKSLIINNKQILSVVAGLDIINNFFIYYTNNANNFCTFSSFLDFCEYILNYTETKTLTNNSNIIIEIISIIHKIMTDNSNNDKLIDDIGIKNALIELLSKISDLNNANINEEILKIPFIFNSIINYMTNNFYYIEEMNYLNKTGIVFNILLIENGLNIINNILNTNSNSYDKILKQFNPDNLQNITKLFDKISILWETDDKINTNLTEEIIKNKYIFDKYKDIPKKNVLIQILLIFDKLLDYKDKYQFQNNNYEQLFNYINEIDINMRLKMRELKINSDGIDNFPILIVYTQTETEVKEQVKSEFSMDIDGLSFYTFKNSIKEGYQSDLEIYYQITNNNNNITREIKTEKDFEVFIQEILAIYENQPNKDNRIVANLQIKLKEKKPKVKRNCINCGNEMEVELDIDEKKLEQLNDFTNIDNVQNFNKLLNESNQLCKNCEKMILEHAKNQINIENSKNNINNLSGINISNLGISNLPVNNTYQNILANNTLRDNLINNNNTILSTSLFNRTLNNSVIRLNDNNNINNLNNNLFGLNSINNISAINPMTPRRDNSIISNNLLNNNINNTFSTNMANYRLLNTKIFQ